MTVSTSNLIYNTHYSIDSDPTTGNPRIKNLVASNIQGDYNNLAIILNELGRRIYPVVRDTNTVILTDGTHTATLTSTSIPATGLLSAKTTVSVSSATAPSSGQVLTATSSTSATWQTTSSGSTSLAGLTTDVTISSASNNDALVYNSSFN